MNKQNLTPLRRNSLAAKASALALALIGSGAWAADSGFYMGGDIGRTKNNANATTDPRANVKKSDTSYGIYGGYQLNRYLAAEVGVARLGTQKIGNTNSKTTTYSLDAIGRLPVSDSLAVYGRLGGAHYERSYNGIPNERAHSVGLKVGVGADYAINKNWAVRTELTRYNHMPVAAGYGQHSDALSMGVRYQF